MKSIPFLLSLLAFQALLRGEEPPSVTALFVDCDGVHQREVERILLVELQSIAAGRDDVTAHPTEVQITCAPLEALIEVKSSGGGRAPKHTVRLDESEGGGKERLIAIAAVELVFSSWVELTQEAGPKEAPKPEPKVEPANVEKNKESPAPATPDRSTVAVLGIDALWRLFVDGGTHLFGGELSLSLPVAGPLYLRAGAAVEGGRAARQLGAISVLSLNGHLAAGFESVFWSLLNAGIEAGFRGGYGFLSATPKSDAEKGTTVKGGFGGPFFRVEATSAFRPRLGGAVELGYAPWGNIGRIEDEPPIKMKGLWVSVLLGVAVDF